jgi:hypothetical protein
VKLFIDTGEGDASSIDGGYRTPVIRGETVVLELAVERQERPNWCWAAIAQAMARYFACGEYRQSEVAAACGCGDAGGDGDTLTLDRALTAMGCAFYWTPGKPSFQRLVFELNRGLPVCARIQWHGGDAHFVVIHGYRSDQALMVADSIDGHGFQPYQAFPTTYGVRSGVWTETYWTLGPGALQ